MIYFDINKQAYGYAIKNPLCTVSEEIWQVFCCCTLGKEYEVTSSGIVDLRETATYKQLQEQQERNTRILEIKQELCVLDTKCLRAIREPAIKDESTGETWLDYWLKKVQKLREELRLLEKNRKE